MSARFTDQAQFPILYTEVVYQKGHKPMDGILVVITLTILRIVLPFGLLLLIGTLVQRRTMRPAK